jgi:uracil-DNA glycosylase family 4
MTKKEQLDQLKKKMQEDMALPLRKDAGEMVFGEGDANADIFFLGEGPGYHESVQGRPFVGNAGKLLDRSLQSIKLDRQKVWITNVVNFRPPDNRDPLPEEIAAYTPYTDKMIEIIDPKVIVTLGRFSMAKFIPGVKISQVHGKVHKTYFRGKETIVYPMFHPAAALRAGEMMRMFTEDFLKLPEILEENLKEKVEEKEEQKPEQLELI